MTYLITGGAGFIGSHLADALLERGQSVVLLDDFSTGRRENVSHLLQDDRVEMVEGSVLDDRLVDDLMEEAETCFHLASAVGVQLVVKEPLESLLRNTRGADNVTGAAARNDVRLLFASTSEVYGKQSNGCLGEDADSVLGSPQTARWGYATAKVFGEMLAYGYHREGGAETIVTRFFNTVGPRQTGAYGMVVPRLVGQALAGEELTIYGDGSQSRCFGHVADAIDALLRLATGGAEVLGRPFNVGNADNEITILELAERILERTGSSSELTLVPYEEAFGEGFEELGRRRPDTSALREATGWKPKRGINEIIDDVIAYQEAGDLMLEA